VSRVLVIGMGVPGFVAATRHAGPGLRSAHFATALAGAGHDVLLLAVLDEHEAIPAFGNGSSGSLKVEFVTEKQLSSAGVRARLARFAPDAVVGVSVYAAALAARLGVDAPLWADAFGDLMAEAQAKAARLGNDWSLVHFWTLLRAVLETADRFSAVSVAQSHALVGQLGLAGRLSFRTAGEEMVAVIPCAAEQGTIDADRQALRGELGIGDDDFVLLASGGVNTWCDVETLAGAVASAMQADSRIHLVVTGGAIPGHDETSHQQLHSLLGRMPAARVHDLGWVDSTRLSGIYAACDLALHVERPLYERRLGAENRVIDWLSHGLVCATTARSETGGELAARGLALACRPGDADDLARVVAEAASNRPALLEAGRRGRRWASEERGFAVTAAPLLQWCDDPCFARDRDGVRLLRLGLLSQPQTSVEMLEAYVAQLSVTEILRRGLRWFARRTSAAAGSALARVRRRNGRNAQARRGSSSLLGLLLLLASLPLGGCRGDGVAARSGRPNVLVLSIDTLRSDHLGAYGYAVTPSPSPWMDRLASSGALVKHAVSSAPETAPALATLQTGVYQDRHGLKFNRANLREENHTLAERLRDAGYVTAAFVGNWLVDAKHGFGQGFDRFEVVQVPPGEASTTDDKLVALFGDFLQGLRRPEMPEGNAASPGGNSRKPGPWYAWVHMMDPHGPYNSAPPWWSMAFDYARVAPSRDGEFPVSDSNFGLGVIPRYQNLEGVKLLSEYVRRYDGDIRYTDSQVGSLLGMLAASGEADNTIVVLVADHGESLGEHDELLQHGWFVYDTTVRVPLLWSAPGRIAAGKRIDDMTCMVDIVPTILDMAAVEADGGDFDGRVLGFGGVDGGKSAGTGSVTKAPPAAAALREAGCFSIGPRANHPVALSTASHKLILTPAGTSRDPRTPKGQVSDAPETIELYDLVADPGETTDLARARPDLVEPLQQSLTTMRSRFRAHGWRW